MSCFKRAGTRAVTVKVKDWKITVTGYFTPACKERDEFAEFDLSEVIIVERGEGEVPEDGELEAAAINEITADD